MTKFTTLEVNIPENMKKVVEYRDDIDWDEIFQMVIIQTLNIYPEKNLLSSQVSSERRH